MTFEDALTYLRTGSKIRRRIWVPNLYVEKEKGTTMTGQDLMAEDWEFYTDFPTIDVTHLSPHHLSKQLEKKNLNEGTKYDSDKNRLDLLSSTWIEGVGKVLTFGAKKYAAHNWRKGIQTSRLMGAAFRHLFAFNRGEDVDPETGLSHLYHASCCLMFVSELLETKPELDDRYKK